MTRDAVGPAAGIHTRMPIALPKDAEAAWLDLALADAAAAIDLARARAVTEFVHHPANPRVNNARSDGAESVEPFAKPAWSIQFLTASQPPPILQYQSAN